MKIPKFKDDNYRTCSNCGRANFAYVSKKCLHKLCEKCYDSKMTLFNSEYNCNFCQKEDKENKIYKLTREDFSNKPILEEFYYKDKAEREKLIYKRKENFKSEEEYNDYLEFVEKCLRKNNLKELEKKYYQDINEKEENYKKKENELNVLKNKIRDYSPTHYNNTRICIDLDDNKNQEEIRRDIDPIVIIEEKIKYIPNKEKEKICGGYNINKLYQFLSNFSKDGLRNRKGTKSNDF